MTLGFYELLAFMAVFLIFSLANTVPFLIYLHKRAARDEALARKQAETNQHMADSCHSFQRELNAQTLKAFETVTNEIGLNRQALSEFMDRFPPKPIDPR